MKLQLENITKQVTAGDLAAIKAVCKAKKQAPEPYRFLMQLTADDGGGGNVAVLAIRHGHKALAKFLQGELKL